MSGHQRSSEEEGRTGSAGGRRGRILRYAAGSGVATVCSEVTFLCLYGPLRASPAVASVVGWLAGAVPSYWLNRTWAWGRRGRASLTREVLPYVAIILGTLLLATLATSAADAILNRSRISDDVRVILVGATFLGVYGVVFLLRYLLFDRLFGHPSPNPSPGPPDSAPARTRA